MSMEKAKLERYSRTVRNIKILEAEIHDMETTDAGMGSDTVLDYRSGVGVPTKVEGFEWEKYEERKGSAGAIPAGGGGGAGVCGEHSRPADPSGIPAEGLSGIKLAAGGKGDR